MVCQEGPGKRRRMKTKSVSYHVLYYYFKALICKVGRRESGITLASPFAAFCPPFAGSTKTALGLLFMSVQSESSLATRTGSSVGPAFFLLPWPSPLLQPTSFVVDRVQQVSGRYVLG